MTDGLERDRGDHRLAEARVVLTPVVRKLLPRGRFSRLCVRSRQEIRGLQATQRQCDQVLTDRIYPPVLQPRSHCAWTCRAVTQLPDLRREAAQTMDTLSLSVHYQHLVANRVA